MDVLEVYLPSYLRPALFKGLNKNASDQFIYHVLPFKHVKDISNKLLSLVNWDLLQYTIRKLGI